MTFFLSFVAHKSRFREMYFVNYRISDKFGCTTSSHIRSPDTSRHINVTHRETHVYID